MTTTTAANYTASLSNGTYWLYSGGIFIAGWNNKHDFDCFLEARGIVVNIEVK